MYIANIIRHLRGRMILNTRCGQTLMEPELNRRPDRSKFHLNRMANNIILK